MQLADDETLAGVDAHAASGISRAAAAVAAASGLIR